MWRHKTRSRGFTLLELSTVLAIIAVLSSVSILSYSAYVRGAKANAAEIQLRLIADLERARVGGPVACAASPAAVPSGQAIPWVPSKGFEQLGFSPGLTHFQYGVQVPGPDGAPFLVLARADLDGDGEASLYTLSASAYALTVERGLE